MGFPCYNDRAAREYAEEEAKRQEVIERWESWVSDQREQLLTKEGMDEVTGEIFSRTDTMNRFHQALVNLHATGDGSAVKACLEAAIDQLTSFSAFQAEERRAA